MYKIDFEEGEDLMIIYFDAPSGIAGDMLVAALIDAGVDFEYIKENIKSLGLDVELSLKERFVNGVKAKHFAVHVHNHDHVHDHEVSSHHHRDFRKIKEIINNSNLNDSVKSLSIRIFEKIAQAEATVHDKMVDEVSFHEVGADDSIVDIIAFSLCIDYLKPDEIYFSPLVDGRGFSKSMHGVIPVPAPAVLEIAKLNRIPFSTMDINSELITPTGIGIAACVSSGFVQMPLMTIDKIGYATGTKELPIPNLLRALIGKKN